MSIAKFIVGIFDFLMSFFVGDEITLERRHGALAKLGRNLAGPAIPDPISSWTIRLLTLTSSTNLLFKEI